MGKQVIWLIDTSVLCNILEVPGRCQQKRDIVRQFRERTQEAHSFLLPLTTVLETGNHIGQLRNPGERKAAGERFVATVLRAIAKERPFAPIPYPDDTKIRAWLPDFATHLDKGSGFGDYLIVRDWKAQIELNRTRAVDVAVWSTDGHLSGFYHDGG